MENDRLIIDLILNKDYNYSKELLESVLARKSLERLNLPIISEADEDPALDPEMYREYFFKSVEEGDSLITIKTIGVGKNKPVSVYIDEKRWEMFPGPKKAEEEAVKFVKSKQFEQWKNTKTESETEEKPEEKPSEEKPEENIKEEVMDSIRDISKRKSASRIRFKDGKTMKVDKLSAETLIAVHDALNKKNKVRFLELINKDKAGFMKAMDFAWKQVK